MEQYLKYIEQVHIITRKNMEFYNEYMLAWGKYWENVFKSFKKD